MSHIYTLWSIYLHALPTGCLITMSFISLSKCHNTVDRLRDIYMTIKSPFYPQISLYVSYKIAVVSAQFTIRWQAYYFMRTASLMGYFLFQLCAVKYRWKWIYYTECLLQRLFDSKPADGIWINRFFYAIYIYKVSLIELWKCIGKLANVYER